MRTLATLTAAAILATLTTPAGGMPADTIGTLPHCQTDESGPEYTRCVWDARHMGNGQGRSFRLNRHGEIKYISHDQAHVRAYG